MSDFLLLNRCRIATFLVITISITIFSITVFDAKQADAITTAQRKAIRDVSRAITRADLLIKRKKIKESAALINKAQKPLLTLATSNDPAVKKSFDNLRKRFKNTRIILQLHGMKFPKLVFPKPSDPTKPTPTVKGEVSFSTDVSAILVNRCGKCHVDKNRGKLSMASFNSLMRGSESGVVIKPRDRANSRLIELLVEKEMPPNGSGIPAKELEILCKWVDQGAKFDGRNRNANIKTLSKAKTAPPAKKLEVVKATGRETVSFSSELAPVLIEKCMGCHGTRNPRANLSFVNFGRLLRGGDTGRIISPGKPSESLLLKKLKGTAGARMPFRQPALSKQLIAKFEKWIAEGAKFDGKSATMPMQEVVTLYMATHATHEELSKQRAAGARRDWKLALSDIQPTILETDNFLLYGATDKKTLQDVADRAEKQTKKMIKYFKLPANGSLIKGRMTLFVFKQRYDYSEFGQMIEKRQLPRSWRGHWEYNVVKAYGTLVIPRDDNEALEGMLLQQISGVYIASQGVKIPRWFSEGSARAILAKMNKKDARVKQWNDRLPRVRAAMPTADAFMTNNLPPDEAEIVSFGFMTYLLKNKSNFTMLLKRIRQGGSFDIAFKASYRTTPKIAANSWARRKK